MTKPITKMTDKPKFIVLVGVPGSGKSTVTSKLIQKYPNTEVVCPDEYRKKLGGSYNNFKDEKKIWSNLCPTDIRNSLDAGSNVIFDATNVGVKRRKSVLQWVNGLDVEKVAIVVQVDIDVAKRQNKLRDPDKIVPDHVIDNMFKSFVYPTKDEGFDKIINAKKV